MDAELRFSKQNLWNWPIGCKCFQNYQKIPPLIFSVFRGWKCERLHVSWKTRQSFDSLSESRQVLLQRGIGEAQCLAQREFPFFSAGKFRENPLFESRLQLISVVQSLSRVPSTLAFPCNHPLLHRSETNQQADRQSNYVSKTHAMKIS